MFKKLLSFSVAVLLINVPVMTPVDAASKEEKEARFTEKVKANVRKVGTGEAARIKIKLRDKTKVAGYISAADDEGFTVIDSKTGTATTIAYAQVQSVQGHNLSTGAKIAIGLALRQPSFLLSFGIQLAPAVINKWREANRRT